MVDDDITQVYAIPLDFYNLEANQKLELQRTDLLLKYLER